ncbi:MAG: TonB-dependent receptor [Bacteroidales bacterium]|jgi:TonB-linked SusC/RagA family outer membrane protein|nr:TonB-dependent receptor [Bacteroidales bacterium]
MVHIEQKKKKTTNTLALFILCCVVMLINGNALASPPVSEANIENKTVFQGIRVTGSVSDNTGELIPGVNVIVRGSVQGTSTDINGEFNIMVPSDTSVLQFSFMGYETQEVVVGNKRVISVQMREASTSMEEVLVVAFGTQKKESAIASVSTLNVAELKVPSSNLTTALAGRVAGLISYQRSGEPGQDNAEFFIRGVTTFGYKQDPLILIDGVELTKDDLARLQVDDISSFSIMKDATATALYGARGANGVILVTTKEGGEGRTKFNFRFENSLSQPTSKVDLVDPITYMRMNNEAALTRADPESSFAVTLPHSEQKIINTQDGLNPMVFPAVDWYSMLLKNVVYNQRLNASISGGGNIARYYVAGTYSKDHGNLKVDKRNNFTNNINLNKYVLRSNVNINPIKTMEVIVRLHATMDDYQGPIDGGTNVYQQIMQTSPVDYPPYYEPDAAHENLGYILFGNLGNNGVYVNPYANLMRGYRQYKKALMLAQVELKQKLDFVTQGLNLRTMFNTNRRSEYYINREYIPYYFNAPAASYNVINDTYVLEELNPNQGTDYLRPTGSTKTVITTTYWETALNYDRTFADKHSASGLLVFTLRDELSSNDEFLLETSLPTRNMGLAGRFTYSFDSRYFIELNFGYNGSERFAKKERWGFFPSVGAGWIISNEAFWNESLKNVISKLKLKATYGLVGNDAIGSETDRFFYLSQVSLNSGNYAHSWGWGSERTTYPGVMISRYANQGITWETSRKTNVGFELELFKQLEIQLDLYRDYRYNIYMQRSDIPGTMGLQAIPYANVGEALSWGYDLSLDYKWSVTKDLWVTARGNFTYATNEYRVYEEPDYSMVGAPWRSRIGQHTKQNFGYVAERLFVDDAEVANSPDQSNVANGQKVRGGDVKYRSIMGDEKITDLDRVPIGHPTSPKINYGFGISSGYKGFDFSFFFQGSAMSSFWLNHNMTSPFHHSGHTSLGGKRGQNQVLQAYADDYWSEANQNVYALWPRLSESIVNNNAATSTWFMQNGSFLRLKSVEFGYSLPLKLIERIRLTSLRFYYSGTNLLCFSKFKMWDPEMAGNGLGYPIQRVHNFGINMSF